MNTKLSSNAPFKRSCYPGCSSCHQQPNSLLVESAITASWFTSPGLTFTSSCNFRTLEFTLIRVSWSKLCRFSSLKIVGSASSLVEVRGTSLFAVIFFGDFLIRVLSLMIKLWIAILVLEHFLGGNWVQL